MSRADIDFDDGLDLYPDGICIAIGIVGVFLAIVFWPITLPLWIIHRVRENRARR